MATQKRRQLVGAGLAGDEGPPRAIGNDPEKSGRRIRHFNATVLHRLGRVGAVDSLAVDNLDVLDVARLHVFEKGAVLDGDGIGRLLPLDPEMYEESKDDGAPNPEHVLGAQEGPHLR